MVFEPFPKIARLKREAVVTEKIDGENMAIKISDDGCEIQCQSRNQNIYVHKDVSGFANWVHAHSAELIKQLGPGIHFGEWWGSGIGRGYGLKEKRFSLFNVHRWHTESEDCKCVEAPLCYVVPTLTRINRFSTEEVDKALAELKVTGSIAAKGYNNPEGVVVFHTQNSALYKVTYEYDVQGKGRPVVVD